MIEYLLLIVGLALLIKGADLLVDGSSALARKYGISSLVIGLTVVAFGTSLPELMVNVYAAFQGAAEIAFGNIIGSNISNILLVLGIGAMMITVKFKKSTVWKEIPFALMAVIIFIMLSNKPAIDGIKNSFITRVDGMVMLFFFIIFIYYIVELAKEKELEFAKEFEVKKHSQMAISLMIMGGVTALYIGGKFTVDGAVAIARQLGVTELLISSTIIAVGTSLPELVTSVIALRKREMELSVGNIIGSNIVNILLIIAIGAIITPLAVPAVINMDLLFLFAATILLFAFMFIGKRHELKRWQGAAFIGVYIAYLIFLIKRG